MSTSFESGSTNPNRNDNYQAIETAWSTLLHSGTKQLYGEETPLTVTGNVRHLHFNRGELWVARYDDEQRNHMGQLLKGASVLPELESVQPIGHIEFLKELPKASLGGAIYLLETEQVAAHTEATVTSDAAGGSDMVSCYEFAKQFGVADSWYRETVQSLIDPVVHRPHETVLLEPLEQAQLAQTLQTIAGGR